MWLTKTLDNPPMGPRRACAVSPARNSSLPVVPNLTVNAPRSDTDHEGMRRINRFAIDQITREVEEDVSRFELDRDQFLEMLRRVEDDVQSEATGS